MGRVEPLEDRLDDQVQESSRALRDVHLRYDASAEDYLVALDAYEQTCGAIGEELVVIRADLRRVLTDEEWAEGFADEEE